MDSYIHIDIHIHPQQTDGVLLFLSTQGWPTLSCVQFCILTIACIFKNYSDESSLEKSNPFETLGQ